MSLLRTAGAYACLILVPSWGFCGSRLWEIMPAGFQTQAFLQPVPGSMAKGVFKIEAEGRYQLQASVHFSGLEPRQHYFLRFRWRPTCTFERELGGDQSYEAPRERPPNTPEHEYASFLARFPAVVSDEHGDVVMSARIEGYLGIDWANLSAALYRGDADPASASWIACGRMGTVRIAKT